MRVFFSRCDVRLIRRRERRPSPSHPASRRWAPSSPASGRGARARAFRFRAGAGFGPARKRFGSAREGERVSSVRPLPLDSCEGSHMRAAGSAQASISRICYVEAEKVLQVRFRDGRLYCYFDVPAEAYDALRDAALRRPSLQSGDQGPLSLQLRSRAETLSPGCLNTYVALQQSSAAMRCWR